MPTDTYTEVARHFGAASDLPSGAYTAHAMSTSGKTIVTPDTGVWAGRRNPRFKQIVAQSAYAAVGRLLIGDPASSLLPAASYAAHAMTTSGKTIVTPDTLSWIGIRQFRLQQILDAPSKAATATRRTFSEAGTRVGSRQME